MSEVGARITSLEKALLKANNLLSSLDEFQGLLSEVHGEISAIERLSADKEAAEVLDSRLKEDSTLKLYGELSQKLALLGAVLREWEEKSEFSGKFLGQFRTTGTFSFGTRSESVDFARKAISLFAVDELLFKPEYIGAVDLAAMGDALGLKRAGMEFLVAGADKIEQIVAYLEKNSLSKNFLLNSEPLKIHFSKAAELVIETTNPRLRRIERLYSEFRAGLR